MTKKRLRVVYLSGPVDAVAVYKSWSTGQQLGYFGASHIKDFFDFCSGLDAEGYVITTLGGTHDRQSLGAFLIENRPMPTRFKGAAYHIANAIWLVSMIPSILRYRPKIAVITAGTNYWILLSILSWVGIVIVPACTCTLWPKFAPMRQSWWILRYFNRFFFRHCVTAVTTMSDDIARQVRSLMGEKKIKISTFLPVYPRSQFSAFRPADSDARLFKVMFAGRIETNKGVYDLVTMAQNLNQQDPGRFHFDICGDGTELNALRHRIVDVGMTEIVTCHGYCERSRLSTLLQESHVVIVPTTTQFEEGFNMVCAEAVLAGRPVVTSAVCPALEYIKEAAIEVPPDDVSAYQQALVDLASNRRLYEEKVAACKALQEQFYDIDNSWGATLREVLEQYLPARYA